MRDLEAVDGHGVPAAVDFEREEFVIGRQYFERARIWAREGLAIAVTADVDIACACEVGGHVGAWSPMMGRRRRKGCAHVALQAAEEFRRRGR